MDNLFSHAGDAAHAGDGPAAPNTPMPSASPEETVSARLPLSPAEAAVAFTEYLHLFWPLGAFSASGEDAHVWWDAAGAGEESDDGEVTAWGTTLAWDWPERAELEFSLDGLEGARLQVRLEPHADGSELHLSGRASATLPASLTDGNGEVWARVVQGFSRFTGA